MVIKVYDESLMQKDKLDYPYFFPPHLTKNVSTRKMYTHFSMKC